MLLSQNLKKKASLLLLTLPAFYFFSQSGVSSDNASALTIAKESPAQPSTEILLDAETQAITSLIASKHQPLSIQPNFEKQADTLAKLYQANGNKLLWLGQNRSQANIDAALTMLDNAQTDGLNPDFYDAKNLRRQFTDAMAIDPSAKPQLATFDTALSLAALRFLTDLHQGRLDPKSFNYPAIAGATSDSFDAATLLKQAIDQQNISQLPPKVEPTLKPYQQLKKILAEYRELPTESPFVALSFDRSLRPGEHHAQLPALRTRLADLGLLSKTELHAGTHYEDKTVAAIKTFQKQQGMTADGIIGKTTLSLLNQSREEKIHRIELAMERLRWLPKNMAGPLIIVNIPAFELTGFNSLDEPSVIEMPVVVGKAESNQTPVLFEEMKYLEFMPYWNIPKSIMDKEILPKLAEDSSYLDNQDMELVQRMSTDGMTGNVVSDIKSGRVRARQRPGRKNPLGKVKFVFPNKADVYMHDTPSRSLFSRSRRDFSHGCVRVSEPEKLAEFVLANQTGWDIENIRKAMSGNNQHVTLKKSVPVLFIYSTSFVDANQQPRFYPDIYDQDAAMIKALNALPGFGKQSGNLWVSQDGAKS